MKTRKRRQDPDAEYNFWQPATDMMSALVYVLLLIIALLGLYLLSDYTGLEEPSSSSEEAASSGWHDDDYDGWHDGGADDAPGDGDGDGRYDQQIIQTGGGGGGYDEDGVKAAVFAELIDEETERRIQEAGVRFELYRTDTAHLINGSLQTLNTYYPEKISYREYETTEEGTFYLPEKIWQGSYYFHQFSEPEGYDAAADTYYDVDRMYDWPEPYIVQIRVAPCKNIIRLQMNDAETQQPVGGGIFRVIAEPHWFYVTSAEDGEGKSTVAANLALQLSDMEKRTLLLDLNTRAPRLGGMFLQDLPYSRTLNALYKGESAEPEAVISLTGYLDLLPMVLEPDAVPLDAALFDFLKPIMEPYEYVIIDASSVGRSSDVLRLNKLADHALFVVRHDATPLPVIQDAIDKLSKSGVQLLGCVVNEVQSLEIFPLHPEHVAAPIRKKKKKPENANSPLPEDLLRPADSALEPTWKPAGDGRSVMDELTDDLQRSQNTRSDDEIMWELLRMGKDGSWKRPERKPTADSSAAQQPQSVPDAPSASGAAPAPQPVPETPAAPVPAKKPKTVPEAPPAPAPAKKPKPVQPEPEAESKAGLLPWTEPEPEPKPETKRSRAPKPAAAPKHGKASSHGGLGLWGKKTKH